MSGMDVHSVGKDSLGHENLEELSGGKPVVLKGIQSVADAEHAAELGVDGIVVSNHADRQVDGAIVSLDALEDIIATGVGEDITVMFDSGVHGAADIMKALCLGAKFVFVGRLWIYGLSIMGEHGVRHVMRNLLAEFYVQMLTMGVKSVVDLKSDRLDSGPRSYSLIKEKARL